MNPIFIKRCFDLAKMSKTITSPNPNVGALLVFDNKIIGEGFTSAYGGPHAEVNCIQSVSSLDCHKIPFSVLYVSLEPCHHFGKTPPCVDLVIDNLIKHVVISCTDPFLLVNSKSIQKMCAAGIEVTEHVYEKEGEQIIRNFRTRILKNRPFITLKMAQSKDGFIGKPNEQVWLTNDISKIMVHKYRGEADAILIGTNTAVIDNPTLNTRLYSGKNPLRVVLDKSLRILETHKLIADEYPTLIFNEKIQEIKCGNKFYHKIDFDKTVLDQVINHLNTLNINSLIVEGGAQILKSFIEKGLWDEAHIYETSSMLHDGIVTPEIPGIETDRIKIKDNTLTIRSKTC
jgi:diaminohydroxyphosphoribosylaminopyrimidine deaminase/5-amino-6-(5-phosphoribosylamino)uracil reductase